VGVGEATGTRHSHSRRVLARTSSSCNSASLGQGVGGQILNSIIASAIAKTT
jgi:hypothetical protein